MSQCNPNEITEDNVNSKTQREKEWQEIEELVKTYQKPFHPNQDDDLELLANNADAAGQELIERFMPLFNKYLNLLKTGHIDYRDYEMKSFISSFIEDYNLQKALNRKIQSYAQKSEISHRFKFIIETYGILTPEEIMMDLKFCFLTIVKRYQPMNRSFCGYLYNAYKFEVSRHIKKYIKNPINIPYKILNYDEHKNLNENNDKSYEQQLETDYCEDFNTGMPNLEWILGNECSEFFKDLEIIERKILVKYYLEEWNDRQIAEEFGIHINTVNQRRRSAVKKIALKLHIDQKDIKRNRRSGKQAVLPLL